MRRKCASAQRPDLDCELLMVGIYDHHKYSSTCLVVHRETLMFERAQ